MKFGLGKKLIFLIEGIVVLVVILSASATFVVLRSAIIENTKSQLISIAVLKEGNIKNYIEKARLEIESFTSIKHRQEYIIKFLQKNEKTEKDLIKQEYFPELLQNRHIFQDILLINTSGVVVASSRESDEGKIKSNEEYFIEGLEKTIVQSFYYDQTILETTIVIASPVKNEEGHVIGVLAGRLGLGEISNLMTERSGLGKSGETFIVSSSNVAITELLKEPGVALKKTIFLPQISTCLAGNSNFDGRIDYQGDTVFGYWHFLPEINSCLVTKIDRGEAYASLYQAAFILTSIAIVVIIFVGIFGYRIGLTISKPIVELRDVALKIKEGNFSVHADISSNDEIGEMALVFNDMADKLNVSYTNLEKKVIERTSDLRSKLLQIEDQNKKLDQNKSAMLNLLEDSKKLEESLGVERDRANAIISSMGEGLLVVDREYKVVLINKKAQELLEIDSDIAVGKAWSEVVNTLKDDKDVPTVERSFAVVIETGKQLITKMEDNHYYKTHSGKTFSVASITAPLFSDDGNSIIGAVKVFRDATHEKEEKALIETEVKERTVELNDEKIKLTSAIGSLPRAFAILDHKGQIVTTNGRFEDVFGKQKEEWSINLIDKLLNNKLALIEKISDVLTNKKIVDIDDIEFGAKFIGIFMAPIIGDDKKLIGAILTIKDVTEEKVLERSKDEFFSIASHELRTPLTAIRGNMSMIQNYYKEQIKDPELKLMITDTYDASIRLIGIVNDFLDLSRLEQKRMEFKLTSFKLNEVVLNVLKDLKTTADEKKITLSAEISDKVVVKADIDKLKEILFNLTGNSLKFTEKGSVTVSAEIAGEIVKIRITDTGVGIPLANQALLFHKFQQANSSTITRDGAKGTGLGLYISKLMVEGMGGTIGLESSVEGKGSVFMFSLPVATQTVNS